MIDFATVKAAADGRWPEPLIYLGIPAVAFNGKHQTCHGCGGEDRFRWDAGKEAFFCGQGGVTTGGDGFALLEHCGWSKKDALHAVAQYFNIENVMLSPEQRAEIAQRKRQAEQARFEATLSHEMHVLTQYLSPRISWCINSSNENYRSARPEVSQPPDDHWQREIEAANTIHYLIEQLYREAS